MFYLVFDLPEVSRVASSNDAPAEMSTYLERNEVKAGSSEMLRSLIKMVCII